MTNDNSQINQVHTPQDAVDQLVGEQFIEWAQDYVSREIKAAPLWQEISTAAPTPDKIRKLILQRYLAEQAFLGNQDGEPGFLGFAIANLSESDEPEAEAPLEILERMQADAAEAKNPWAGLLADLGVPAEDLERTKIKDGVRSYIAELSDLFSNSPWQTAIGALAAYEWGQMAEYSTLAQILELRSGLDTEKQAIDIGHILDKAVADAQDKQLAWDGINRELVAKQEFLAALAKYLY